VAQHQKHRENLQNIHAQALAKVAKSRGTDQPLSKKIKTEHPAGPQKIQVEEAGVRKAWVEHLVAMREEAKAMRIRRHS
jgi:hypothetical protein